MKNYYSFLKNFGTEIAIRLHAGKYRETAIYSINESLHKSKIILGDGLGRGENVYNKDWDVLVILDACRVDLLESVVDEYEWLPETVYSTTSVGWNSPTWLENTFTKDYLNLIKKTNLITANPHTEKVLNENTDISLETFSNVSLLYQHRWDSKVGTVQPDIVTDTAIEAGRKEEFDRLVVHYMQPHFPSIPNPELESGIEYVPGVFPWKNNIWERLKRGQIDEATVWNAYKENLRHVLEYVNKLRTNIDSDRFIISADHGNAVGEKGYYGHSYNLTDAVWNVPWVEVSAEDRRTREVDLSKTTEEKNVDEKLKALGYKL